MEEKETNNEVSCKQSRHSLGEQRRCSLGEQSRHSLGEEVMRVECGQEKDPKILFLEFRTLQHI